MLRPIALAAALLALLATAAPSRAAEEPIEIFDAHLHYNFEPTPTYQPDEVLALLKKYRVTGILSTSRPNTGTHVLMAAKAEARPATCRWCRSSARTGPGPTFRPGSAIP
jgi:hypothetical protein